MGSLTARGRALVVVAFVASAALASGAAVVLVKAGDHDRTPGTTLPRVTPTLVFPSGTPTPTPSATATPSARPTASVTPSATPSPTASPAATASRSPRPRETTGPLPDGLRTSAVLDPAEGYITTADTFTFTAHATDGEGRIVLEYVKWGDGTTTGPANGTRCSAPAGGDCRDYRATHRYAKAGDPYTITVLFTSGTERATYSFDVTVLSAPPSPTPTPTSSPSPSPTAS